MDTIQCQHCQANGIPRLWHYRPILGGYRYMKTQHICHICGSVMYETGGEISPWGTFMLFVVVGVSLGIIDIVNKGAWWLKILDPVVSLSLIGFIGYKILRRIVRMFH